MSISLTHSNDSTTLPGIVTTGELMQIRDVFGRSILLAYSGMNLSSVSDPAGNSYTYGFDSDGNLSSVTYPDQFVRSYVYNEPANTGGTNIPTALTGIIDENGIRFATFGYNAIGQGVLTEHAGGAFAYSLNYSSDPIGNVISTIVGDPLGANRVFAFSNIFGVNHVSAVSQPNGVGSNPASTNISYDANGNAVSKADFDGNITCFSNDLNRNLEIARVEGIIAATPCPPILSTYVPPSGGSQRLIQTHWHPTWRMKTQEAAPLKLTTWVYNGQADPTNSNVPAICAPGTKAANLPGLLLHFDAANASTKFIDVYGHAVSAAGAGVDISNIQSVFGGAALYLPGTGWLQTADSQDIDFGAGDFTMEGWLYANTLAYMGIFSQRPQSTSYGPYTFGLDPDGSLSVVMSYSGGNWDVNLTTAAGIFSTGVWHHVALVRYGGTVSIYVDGVLRGSAPISSSLVSVASDFVIGSDAVVSNAPGGLQYWNGYIDEVRVVKGQALYTSNFTVPTSPLSPVILSSPNVLPDGNPIAVLCKRVEQGTTDTTGGAGFGATASGVARVWSYTYNQYGQRLTATGPRGNLATGDPNYAADTTTYSYYASTVAGSYTMGDLQSVTDAAGHTTSYPLYDGNGRVLQSVDPNGTTTAYTYYPRGWLKSRTVTPSGSATSQVTGYVYDGVGQLKTVTNPDGTTVSYTYDNAHRLTTVTDSAGDSINYTLDGMGNRISEQVKDPAGNLARQITRVYDQLNRLQTVTGALQ